MVNNNKNERLSSSGLDKIKKFQIRLNGWGIFLIVVGCAGLASLFVLLVYLGVKQSTSLLKRTWPFIFNLISIVVSSLIMSAGIYMYKTSKSIKQELKKISDKQNNE